MFAMQQEYRNKQQSKGRGPNGAPLISSPSGSSPQSPHQLSSPGPGPLQSPLGQALGGQSPRIGTPLSQVNL